MALQIKPTHQMKPDHVTSPTLSSSVNTWTYTPKLGFEPTHVVIKRILYFNSGTDTGIYMLRSDMFRGVGGYGASFMENDKTIINIEHKLPGSVNGRTFTFEVRNSADSGQPAGGTLDVSLEFYDCGSKQM
jgi:hypothetical protein